MRDVSLQDQSATLLPPKSAWQQTSEAVQRSKRDKKRRRVWRKRILLCCGLSLAAYCGIMGSLLWRSGLSGQLAEGVSSWLASRLNGTGLSVQAIAIEGLEQLSADDVLEYAQLQNGQLLFALSLPELKARLEAHPMIAKASLSRHYPGELSVVIREREAVALWQYQGQAHWIDASGVVMQSPNQQPNQPTIIVTGNAAPKHFPELWQLLHRFPEMRDRVEAVQWVGSRRWNIWLMDETRLLLPETAAMPEALARLMQMHRQYQLLDRAVSVIDMRIEGQMFIRYQSEPSTDEKKDDSYFTAQLQLEGRI